MRQGGESPEVREQGLHSRKSNLSLLPLVPRSRIPASGEVGDSRKTVAWEKCRPCPDARVLHNKQTSVLSRKGERWGAAEFSSLQGEVKQFLEVKETG